MDLSYSREECLESIGMSECSYDDDVRVPESWQSVRREMLVFSAMGPAHIRYIPTGEKEHQTRRRDGEEFAHLNNRREAHTCIALSIV